MPPAAEFLQGTAPTPSLPPSQGTLPYPHSAAPSNGQSTKSPVSKVPSVVSTLEVSFSFNGGDESTASADVSAPASSACPDSIRPDDVATKRPATWQAAVEASELSLRTVNPIRKITDAVSSANLSPSSLPKKAAISLGAGDPTISGHLIIEAVASEAVRDAALSGKFNGYAPSLGLPATRQALATHLTSAHAPADVSKTRTGPRYSASDVYITSGCGHSFQLCLEALANPGKNILLPRPGFPVYDCWCAAAGLEIRRYRLRSESQWEVDLEEVRELADANTVAILLCQPGNPCGNTYSETHLREVLSLAESLKLPVISDEIYAGISFYGTQFTPAATVAAKMRAERLLSCLEDSGADADADVSNGCSGGSVPVLTISSISKTLLVPGWRLGWIAVHDPDAVLKSAKVIQALENRMQFTPPSCTLIQAALPKMLSGISQQFYSSLNSSLERALSLCLTRIDAIPGLSCPGQPQGGMFLMVCIDLNRFRGFGTDIEWCREVLVEENVVVIPGTAFEFPGWFRTLISAPDNVLEEAWDRIAQFCKRHAAEV